MKRELTPKHSKIVLKKLCSAVGVDYKSFNFKQKNWYWKHSWTEKEEEKFHVWLGKFLVKHKYASKGTYRGQNAGYYEAGKMLLNYGWKTKSSQNEKT